MVKKKAKKLMGVQQVLIHTTPENQNILQYLCEQSGKLYNTGVYFARQTFFKTGKILSSKFDLIYEQTVSKTRLSQSLPSIPAQQTLMSVPEAFSSFKELRALHLKGELNQRPKVPGYLKGKKLYKVAFPANGAGKPTIVDGQIRFPLGRAVKRWFGVQYFYLPLPTNLNLKKVREFTILPKNGAFYLEVSYLVDKPDGVPLDPSKAMGIDLGTGSNLAACVDTLGNSFLIDAFTIKAMNQLWNKKVATRKEGKCKDYWDGWLDRVTRKRNHQMRDAVNKTVQHIIQHCLANQIGTLVIGWNEGFKTNSNMGRVNNQKFVQIPLGKIKDRLQQLCDLHGIQFVVTEESYTSKASFLDGDTLPVYGQKPDGWAASGKRVRRGLYRTANGHLINADLNGAANILSKVSSKLELDLSRLSRRCLTTVARIRLWCGKQKNPLPSR